MAAASNDSVLECLVNETQSLENRLKIALSIFTTTDLYSINSQVAVLEWMKQKLIPGISSEDSQKILYAVLKQCISSISEISFRPRLTKPILEILLNCDGVYTEILDCFIALLQSTHFLKHFIFHVNELTNIVVKYIGKLKQAEVDVDVKISGYRITIHAISRVNNHALHDHNLKLLFVGCMMEPISVIYNDFKNILSASDFDVLSVETLVQEVLFKNANFKNAYLRNLFVSTPAEDSDFDKMAVEIIKKIQEYPALMKPELLAISYSLLLSGFLGSNSSNDDIFKVFVALNSFIYVRPIAIDTRNERCVLLQENTNTVTELTKLLLAHDLPLESQWNFTFSAWLSTLIDTLLNKLEGGITSQLLILLKNLLSFSPTLIEENMKKLTKYVMLIKKSGHDTLKAYSELCLHVLHVHVKLNRIPKLISVLLITIRENSLDFEVENVPDKFDVFSAEVFDFIQNAITNLPSTVVNVGLLNTLFFHLENDCIAALEHDSSKEVDIRWILLYDIISYLTSCFIRGTRVVDHSVPDVVKSKFISLMESLAVLLGRFGKAIISKSHVPQLCECFFHLCLVWGDMQILLMIYETRPRKVSKQVGIMGKAPTNLGYLHPYLSDFHWKIIAQRVVNFGNDSCVNLLNDLVLQKIHAIPYLEDELQGPYLENIFDDDPSVVSAQYLINHAHSKWLFAHVSEFLHLLKPTDILLLSKNLISHCQQCSEKEIDAIFSANFRELRPLVVGMICYTFYSLGKKFASHHLKEIKRMLRKIDYEELLQAEDQDVQAVEAVNEKLLEISSYLSTDFVHVDVEIPGDSFKTDLYILNNLPLRYLRPENKSLVCLLTLSLMKNLIRLKFVRYNASDILLQSCKLLQGILTGTDVPNGVDCGRLLAWFYHGLKNTPYCDLILRSICKATRKYGCGVDSVIEIIKAVHDDNRTDVFIESKSESIDLLTTYLVNFEKIRIRKGDLPEAKEKLEKLCYKNFDEIFHSSHENSERGEKQLALFTLLLRQSLKSNDEEHLRQLLARLPHFIEISKQYEDTSSDEFSRFLFILLKNNRVLQTYLPNNFFIDTWCEYFHSLDAHVINVLLRVASLDEYNEMLEILLAFTEGTLSEPVDENLEILDRVWKVVLDMPVKEAKVQSKKRIIPHSCILAQKYTISMYDSTRASVAKFFLKLFASFLHNRAIPVNYEVIDVCFALITSITSIGCGDVSIPSDCVELLFVFSAVHEKLLLNRIPSFYLCYKSLYIDIVRKCSVEEDNDAVAMATAAHKMEKLTDLLAKNKKDFSKTAISAVADFLGAIATVHVIDGVKNHVKNIIYCWIGICDSHGLQYLSSSLPSASQTLFKQYWTDYNKYYKFSGKV